jgi:predicted nucleotidyltransferase
MNIHFTDKELFERLKKSSLIAVTIGSTMYGTNDENSDVDILYVYVPSIECSKSFTHTHHQFQYKENDVDHIFVDIFSFIRNSLNGDSTINFEIINHESLSETYLSFLYDMRYSFYNYKILRSYLGMCRRDMKYLNKGDTERDKNKKLGHILRGYMFAKSVLNKSFSSIITGELLDEIKTIKSFNSKERHERALELTEAVSNLRNDVNEKLDHDKLGLATYMSIEDQTLLDSKMKDLIDSDVWKNKEVKSLGLLKYIYDVNENDLTYN